VARMLEQTRNIKSIVGDRKLLITTLCAPFTAAGTMAGVSGYMKIARKTPEIVDPLVDYAVAACAAIADLMCENGCDIIAFCDPSASGDMISPKLFERLSAPALKKLRGAVTSAKIFFLHICGNTIMRIPTVNTLGVDGFSIDFKVNLAEALSAAAPNLTILGNIAPSDLLMSGTPQEVYDESYRCVELGGLEGGYVLMPGCDIPAQCALENVLAMTRAAEDYAAKVRA